MTDVDMYVMEARRRVAWQYEKCGMGATAQHFLGGNYDVETAVQTLAAALRELNWQPPAPPVDPDLLLARKIAAEVYDAIHCFRLAKEARGGTRDSEAAVRAALAAIKRVRAAD